MPQQIKMLYEAPACALEKWNPTIKAAAQSDDTTINIYSTIGEYGDGSGMTAKIVSSILRKAEGKDVVVNINSPGGDFFEGLAINSLLSEYEGSVTVRVLGMAASAASIVAMAGDTIAVAESAFIMIHNSWTMAIGNKADMKNVADTLAQFDESMVNLYARKTKKDEKEIRKMMDAETWIQGKNAVENNFATELLGESSVSIDKSKKTDYNSALRKIDVALAKAGMPRTERRELLKELSDTPSAVDQVTPSADTKLSTALQALLDQFKNQTKGH